MRLKKQTLLAVFMLLCLSTSTFAQYYPRSTYFMENLPTRNKLNPAFRPDRGYFNVPVFGSFGASVASNALSVNNFTDIMDDENSFLDNPKFMNRLKTDNTLNMDLGTDILSFGFYSGKGFWTVDLGVKVMVNTSIPKTMFEFARDADKIDLEHIPNFNIRNMQLYGDIYGELAVGYSRPITEKLTVGGKLKVLLGAANFNAKIEQLQLQANGNVWNVTTKGEMNLSMKGLELTNGKDENGEEYISDVDFDSPGISGFGLGADLGATYQLLDNLCLSASIIDLGFIKWNGSSTSSYIANQQHTYDPYGDYGDFPDLDIDGDGVVDEKDLEAWKNEYSGSVDIFDMDLFQFKETASKKRTTTLRSTLNIGAEYTILNNKIGFGLLSTTRFILPKAFTELMVSANFRPARWFEGTVSYSFIHSNFKTFGLGMKFGPLFIGTDYMITKGFNTLQTANAYLGISVPLGKKKPANS